MPLEEVDRYIEEGGLDMEWPFILALVLAIPVVLFAPVLIWAAVVSGLFRVVIDRLRRRITVRHKRVVAITGEPAVRKGV